MPSLCPLLYMVSVRNSVQTKFANGEFAHREKNIACMSILAIFANLGDGAETRHIASVTEQSTASIL